MVICQHNTLVTVVSAALGGSKETSAPPRAGQDGVKDLAAGHSTAEAAIAAINAALTF